MFWLSSPAVHTQFRLEVSGFRRGLVSVPSVAEVLEGFSPQAAESALIFYHRLAFCDPLGGIVVFIYFSTATRTSQRAFVITINFNFRIAFVASSAI